MSNKTIYDFEPNYDDYECDEQYWIDAVYGFRNILEMHLPDREAIDFLEEYCKVHDVENPLESYLEFRGGMVDEE